ncbi:MAG: SusC/RagA family TonB-linked outer membrane protein, partial [Segetibacter sp.]
ELLLNRYTPGSMDSKYPILPLLDTRTDVSGLSSTFWLRDASFVRLKTLELSYSIPQSLLSKIKVSGLRFYLNGNNLITIDKLKIYDPEASNERGNFYPQSKIYNLGLNLTF